MRGVSKFINVVNLRIIVPWVERNLNHRMAGVLFIFVHRLPVCDFNFKINIFKWRDQNQPKFYCTLLGRLFFQETVLRYNILFSFENGSQ